MTTRGRSRSSRTASAISTGRSRPARARCVLDHRPARVAGLAEPALALRQPDAPGALLGAPALPGPRREPVGGDRRPLQGQRLGGGLQPHERAGRRVARASSARSTRAWRRRSAPSTRTTSCSSTATRTRPSSTSSASRSTTPSTRCTTTCPRASVARTTTTPRGGEQKFLRALGVRARDGDADLVGEFGPIYTGDPRRDDRARRRSSTTSSSSTAGTTPASRLDVQGPRPPGPDLRDARTRPTARSSPTSSPRRSGSARISGAATGASTPEVTRRPGARRSRVPGLRPVSVGPLRLGADAGAQHHVRPADGRGVCRALSRARRQRARGARRLVRLRSSAASASRCATSSARELEMRRRSCTSRGAPLRLEELELAAARRRAAGPRRGGRGLPQRPALHDGRPALPAARGPRSRGRRDRRGGRAGRGASRPGDRVALLWRPRCGRCESCLTGARCCACSGGCRRRRGGLPRRHDPAAPGRPRGRTT